MDSSDGAVLDVVGGDVATGEVMTDDVVAGEASTADVVSGEVETEDSTSWMESTSTAMGDAQAAASRAMAMVPTARVRTAVSFRFFNDRTLPKTVSVPSILRTIQGRK